MENRPLMRQLGDNVRRLRKDCRLSLAEVSARMGALGVPVSLNGLSKVELGNRDLGLDELGALAHALEVPPLLLIFPLGRERAVELFPGSTVDTWAAAKWFTGEAPLPGDDSREDWPTNDFREQDRLLSEWGRFRRRLTDHRALMDRFESEGRGDMALALARSEDVPMLEEILRTTEDQLRRHRINMRKAGLDPGELPAEAAHIDGAPDGQR